MSLLLAIVPIAGCGTGRDQAPGAGAGTAPPGTGGLGYDGVGSAAPGPPSPPVSEVDARDLLRREFRDAGLRVVSDVRLRGAGFDITVDGYDPEREVGFEYVAADEVDTDVAAGEREALAASDSRVLLVDASSADALALVTRAFLGRVAAEASADHAPAAATEDD